MPRGVKWVPPDLREIETIAERGVTFDYICQGLGITVAALRRRRKDLTAVDEAIARGRARGGIALANKAYEVAMVDRDPSMIRFLCRATGVIDDRIRVELTGKDGAPIVVQADIKAEIDVKVDPAVQKLMESYASVARAAIAGAADAGDVAGEPG